MFGSFRSLLEYLVEAGFNAVPRRKAPRMRFYNNKEEFLKNLNNQLDGNFSDGEIEQIKVKFQKIFKPNEWYGIIHKENNFIRIWKKKELPIGAHYVDDVLISL